MLKKEELFQLVKSLTKSEKRYFKLFCTREVSGENYLRLFEVIDQQEHYDEKAIKQRFRSEKFVSQLHVTKNYLRNLILKSLRNFHAQLSKNVELKAILQNVEILYHKELYQHCLTELKRAKKLAETHELILGKLEVENWSRKLAQTMNPSQLSTVQDILNEQKHTLALLVNKQAYWQLALDVSRASFQQANQPIPNELLLNDEVHAKTLEAKGLFYNTNYLRNLQLGNHQKAEQQLETLIHLLEENPLYHKKEPVLYVSSINNLVAFWVFYKRHEEALALIQKAKAVYESWKITAANQTLLKQILRTYNIEMEIYRDSSLFSEKLDFIQATESFILKNKDKIPLEYLHSFWFQLASIHFKQQDFKQSLKWINKLLNTKDKQIRNDLIIQAYMLNLMVHFEQQNLMVLRYYVDSTKRYLKKVKQVQEFERLLLKFFIKLSRLPKYEYKSAFTDLQAQLFPQGKEKLISTDILNYIDYEDWITSKSGQLSKASKQ